MIYFWEGNKHSATTIKASHRVTKLSQDSFWMGDMTLDDVMTQAIHRMDCQRYQCFSFHRLFFLGCATASVGSRMSGVGFGHQ